MRLWQDILEHVAVYICLLLHYHVVAVGGFYLYRYSVGKHSRIQYQTRRCSGYGIGTHALNIHRVHYFKFPIAYGTCRPME
jgi:hypothetical protein